MVEETVEFSSRSKQKIHGIQVEQCVLKLLAVPPE